MPAGAGPTGEQVANGRQEEEPQLPRSGGGGNAELNTSLASRRAHQGSAVDQAGVDEYIQAQHSERPPIGAQSRLSPVSAQASTSGPYTPRQQENGKDAAWESRPLLLITTVDIGEGKADKIVLREGDKAEDAAAAFCAKNGLASAIVGPLTRHIEDNLLKAQQEAAAEAAEEQQERSSLHRGSGYLGSSEAEQRGYGARQGQQAAKPVRQPAGGAARAALAESAPKSGRSVFDRLYGHARELQAKQTDKRKARDRTIDLTAQISAHSITWVSEQLMKGRNSGNYGNYGERLYVEGLMELEKRRAAAELHKAERIASELMGATWHPEISGMAKSLKRPDADLPSYMRLSAQRTSKTQERLEAIKREQEVEAERECTFQPAINGRSARLMAERSEVLKEHHITAHEQLFQDATRRRMRAEEYAQWFPEDVTFHPRLTESSKTWDSEKLRAELQVAVADRLYENGRKVQEHLEAERRNAEEHPVDPATGQPFFHPQIGRGPKHQRNEQNKPIGDYLHNFKAEYNDKNEQMKTLNAQQFQQAATTAFTLHRSQTMTALSKARLAALQNLMARLKAKRFRQIFEYLDQDQDGLLDLAELLSEDGQLLMETLDPEVRSDVELGAQIWARRRRGQDQRAVATIAQLQGEEEPLAEGAAALEGAEASVAAGPAPTVESSQLLTAVASAPTVTIDQFKVLMEEALARTRGIPRSYLLPSPAQRLEDAQLTFKPRITQRSEMIALRNRPEKASVYDLLHQEASQINQKLEAKRAAKAAAQMEECTFQPMFTSQRLVEHGRALRDAQMGSTPYAYPDSPESRKYEELEREVRQALAATALTNTARKYGPTHQTYLPSQGVGDLDIAQGTPQIGRWTGDDDDIVAEIAIGAQPSPQSRPIAA